LLGNRAWGLPRWLDKLVLNFDIEGEKVRDRGLPSTETPVAVGGNSPEPSPSGTA